MLTRFLHFLHHHIMHPSRTIMLAVLLVLGLLLAGLNFWQHYNNREAAITDRAVYRTYLLDSVATADERRVRQSRRATDSTLTRTLQRQAAASDHHQRTDEAIESRYRATRVPLPAL